MFLIYKLQFSINDICHGVPEKLKSILNIMVCWKYHQCSQSLSNVYTLKMSPVMQFYANSLNVLKMFQPILLINVL